MEQVLLSLNDIFDTLLKALSDPSDEVICSWWLVLCLINLVFMDLQLISSLFFWNLVFCTPTIPQFFLAAALKYIFTFFLLYWHDFKTTLFEKLHTCSVNFVHRVWTTSVETHIMRSSTLAAVLYYWGCFIILYVSIISHFYNIFWHLIWVTWICDIHRTFQPKRKKTLCHS